MSESDHDFYPVIEPDGSIWSRGWVKARSFVRPLTHTATESTFKGLVYEMRPWQWYKQSILFVAIIFSGNLGNPLAWYRILLGIVAFSAVASAMYIFNDISDIEQDRNHPTKQHRPIASGQVRVSIAGSFGALLVVAGLLLAYQINMLVLFVILAYIGQTTLYSLALKAIPILDLLVIAIGFVLRAVAGVFAIDTELSPWLIVCTLFAALLLAIGKRFGELEDVDEPANTRDVLQEYTTSELTHLLAIVSAVLLMAYTLYTVLGAAPTMMLTLPFAYFGVLWYHHQVVSSTSSTRPERLVFTKPFLANLVLWTVTAIAVLYWLPSASHGLSI